MRIVTNAANRKQDGKPFCNSMLAVSSKFEVCRRSLKPIVVHSSVFWLEKHLPNERWPGPLSVSTVVSFLLSYSTIFCTFNFVLFIYPVLKTFLYI